jgi:hypothetical protein
MLNVSTKINVILSKGFGHCTLLKPCQAASSNILIGDISYNNTINASVQNRSFMSDNFQCTEAWQERLNVSPIYTLEMNKYYFELERKYTREGIYLPIDVDIFANALLKADGNQKSMKEERINDRLDQMQEMLQRFRQTPQTNFMLPSTTHAIIRSYLDGHATDKLLNILEERQKFGLFPDDLSLIHMLNYFLTNSAGSNWKDASKVSIMMMLQEEYDIPIGM